MGKDTYVAVGNAEDISNVITTLSKKITPFFSDCGKTRATATYHEWLEDSLRKERGNKQVEGFEYAVEAPVPRVRLGNFSQIFAAGYGVTATQEAVLKHGVNSEKAYQMAKASKEIAKDIEYAILTQATRTAGSASVARQFGGVPFWITTNAIASAAGEGLTEALMNDALQACWDENGEPSKVYLSGKNKRAVSSWSGDGDKYLEQNSKKLVNSIAVYESDFGVISFTAHRMMPDDKVFVIDPEYWKVGFVRPLHTYTLPRTGDSLKAEIVGELTLEARAEKANAIITLTPPPPPSGG